ncbi:MAG: oligosaccharide flippase family protein [Pseudoalteromonas sp.]
MSYKKQGSWLLISSAVAGVVQLSIFAMLAYYTSPEVLGVLAIVNIFLAIAYLIQDMGLSNYYIYKQQLTRPESSTLYYTNCALGILAGLLIALIAGPVASFYESLDIRESLYIMSLNFVLLGVSAQYQANFIKSERNIALAKIDIIVKIAMLISTFVLIKLDIPSVFPYLYSYLLVNLLKYLLFLLLAEKSWHPTFEVDLKILKPAVEFGLFQMGSQIVSQVRTQLDQLIIGKLMGIEILGLYSFAKELILQPVKFIRILIGRMVYPKLAKLQDHKAHFYAMFDKSIVLLSAINTAIYLVFFSITVTVVSFYFEQYYNSIPVLFSLLIMGFLIPFGSLLGVSAQAKGNTKIEFQWSIISATISVAVLYLLTQLNDINSFAIGVGALQVIITSLAYFFYSYKDKGLPKKSYFTLLLSNLVLYILINLVYFNK